MNSPVSSSLRQGLPSDDVEIKIHSFDPYVRLPKYGVMVFTGRTGSGKTVAMRNIMKFYRKKVDNVVVFTGSKSTAAEMAKHVPWSMIWIGFHPNRLKRIYECQEAEAVKNKKSLLLVFDDLAYLKKSIVTNETIGRILYNSRHARIVTLMSIQYSKDIPPSFRQQLKLVFVSAEKQPENRERIYDSFNPVFKKFQTFDEVMRRCTVNHNLLVLDMQHNESTAIADNVFFYRPHFPVPSFKINRKGLLWKYDRLHLDAGTHELKESVDDRPSARPRALKETADKKQLDPAVAAYIRRNEMLSRRAQRYGIDDIPEDLLPPRRSGIKLVHRGRVYDRSPARRPVDPDRDSDSDSDSDDDDDDDDDGQYIGSKSKSRPGPPPPTPRRSATTTTGRRTSSRGGGGSGSRARSRSAPAPDRRRGGRR